MAGPDAPKSYGSTDPSSNGPSRPSGSNAAAPAGAAGAPAAGGDREAKKGVEKIEPKVWFANERTWLNWSRTGVLLGTFGVALVNSSVGPLPSRTFPGSVGQS